MDIRMEPFQPAHFFAMRLREEDERDMRGVPLEVLLAGFADGTTALTHGEPAFFYGAQSLHGVARLWAVASPLVDRLPLLVTRLGLASIGYLLASGHHRVEALCHTGNARSLRWLTRSLGFEVEGLMRRCGPNALDRYLLSIVREA